MKIPFGPICSNVLNISTQAVVPNTTQCGSRHVRRDENQDGVEIVLDLLGVLAFGVCLIRPELSYVGLCCSLSSSRSVGSLDMPVCHPTICQTSRVLAQMDFWLEPVCLFGRLRACVPGVCGWRRHLYWERKGNRGGGDWMGEDWLCNVFVYDCLCVCACVVCVCVCKYVCSRGTKRAAER